MVDPTWQNPYQTVPSTAGIFSFWPYPSPSEAVGQQKDFELEILVDEALFETFRHYFIITLVAKENFLDLSSSERVYSLPDLYLIPGK